MKITQIGSNSFGIISVGSDYIFACPTIFKGKPVYSIQPHINEELNEQTYFIHFVGTKATLEILDAYYVIRDEV